MKHPGAAGTPGETPEPQACRDPWMPSVVPESQDCRDYPRVLGLQGPTGE